MRLNSCRFVHGEHVCMYSYMYVHEACPYALLCAWGRHIYVCAWRIYVYAVCTYINVYVHISYTCTCICVHLCKGHVHTPPYRCARVQCVHAHLLNHVHYTLLPHPANLQSTKQCRTPDQPAAMRTSAWECSWDARHLLRSSDFWVVLPPSAPSLQPGLGGWGLPYLAG